MSAQVASLSGMLLRTGLRRHVGRCSVFHATSPQVTKSAPRAGSRRQFAAKALGVCYPESARHVALQAFALSRRDSRPSSFECTYCTLPAIRLLLKVILSLNCIEYQCLRQARAWPIRPRASAAVLATSVGSKGPPWLCGLCLGGIALRPTTGYMTYGL